jgi:hypothetical protein
MDKINFNVAEYVKFLGLLIYESEHLQNGDKHTAEEIRVANHVIDYSCVEMVTNYDIFIN